MHTSTRKKISLKTPGIILLFLLLFFAGFRVFVQRYLPAQLKKKLSEVIVNGSDSLYQFRMGKFDLSFWGSSARITDLHITIDSTVYRQMKIQRALPSLTATLHLPQVQLNGLGLKSLLFSRKLNIDEIIFDSAAIQLARHFRQSTEEKKSDQPLWKRLKPHIRSVDVGNMYCANLTVGYRNIDSAAAFAWHVTRSSLVIRNIRVDSAATYDSRRLLFAQNLSFNAKNIHLKTPDGLYQLRMGELAYVSAERSLQVKGFDLLPAMSEQQFLRRAGKQRSIYTIKVPVLVMKEFELAQWVTHNRLQSGQLEMASPSVMISMDRRLPPDLRSKKGRYPQQLLQKADFIIDIRRLSVNNALVSYTEISSITGQAARLIFPSLNGHIQNITNDPVLVAQQPDCVADFTGSILQQGKLQARFRFDLASSNGSFNFSTSIRNLSAAGLQPLFKAMAAIEMQSFNLEQLNFSMQGHENSGTGSLSMHYTDMDILIHKVEAGKLPDKKGLLSFFANRLLIYKENPAGGDKERKAVAVAVQRDEQKSFFHLIWQTLLSSAGEIVLRPMGKRKIEKRKQQSAAGSTPAK